MEGLGTDIQKSNNLVDEDELGWGMKIEIKIEVKYPPAKSSRPAGIV